MTTLDKTDGLTERLADAAAIFDRIQAQEGNNIDGDSEPHWSSQTEALAGAKACRDAIDALSSLPAQAVDVTPEWRCFHCDEVFTDDHAARLHFGTDERTVPACQIKGSELGLVEALRRAENDAAEAWHAIHNETTDASKAYYRMVTRHQEQLRAVEQVGYDRAIADAKAHPETLGLALMAEAQLSAIPLKVVGYGRDAGRLTRVEVLDGADRIDLFRPPSQPAAVGVTDEMEVEITGIGRDGHTGKIKVLTIADDRYKTSERFVPEAALRSTP